MTSKAATASPPGTTKGQASANELLDLLSRIDIETIESPSRLSALMDKASRLISSTLTPQSAVRALENALLALGDRRAMIQRHLERQASELLLKADQPTTPRSSKRSSLKLTRTKPKQQRLVSVEGIPPRIEQTSSSDEAGFIYFKRATYLGLSWYKLGFTRNPERRDIEQNVTPAPLKTICVRRWENASVAEEVERYLHFACSSYQIKGANNRELYRFTEQQARAVHIALLEMGEAMS